MIFNMVKGYSIPFTLPPQQSAIPISHLSQKEIDLVDQEVQNMLRKGAPSKAEPVGDQFPSSIFLVKKNDKGYRPVINLKVLNRNILYTPQNGRFVSFKRNAVARGSDVQNRPEGCIFLNPFSKEISEICQISVDALVVQILKSTYWSVQHHGSLQS